MTIRKSTTEQTTIYKRRTDNTMTKRRRTENTMAKRRTDNTMAKGRRTENTMAKRRTENTMAKRNKKKKTNNDLQTHKTKVYFVNFISTVCSRMFFIYGRWYNSTVIKVIFRFPFMVWFCGVRVTRSLVLYVHVCFVYRCLSFCAFFLLTILLSVLLRYTDSDYPFGIFKLFF